MFCNSGRQAICAWGTSLCYKAVKRFSVSFWWFWPISTIWFQHPSRYWPWDLWLLFHQHNSCNLCSPILILWNALCMLQIHLVSLLMWKLRSLIEIDTVEYMENVPACMENYVSGNRCIVDGLDSAISFGISWRCLGTSLMMGLVKGGTSNKFFELGSLEWILKV